jgi:hypothetical protein
VNSRVPRQALKTDPFEVNTNSSVVRVLHENHGFKSGDRVDIRGVVDGTYGANSATIGIDSEFFNGTHTVSSVDFDSYTIPVTNADVVDTTGATTPTVANLTHDFVGGSGITATRNIAGDVIQLAVSQVKLPGTDIQYRWTGMDAGYSKNATTNISENSNYYPSEREIIASEQNQNVNLNGGRNVNTISGTSANVVCNQY